MDSRGTGAARAARQPRRSGRRSRWPRVRHTVRPFVLALAYLLGGFTDFHQHRQVQPAAPGPAGLRRRRRRGARWPRSAALLGSWGYRGHDRRHGRPAARCCSARSCCSTAARWLTDLTTEAFDAAARAPSLHRRHQRQRRCTRCSAPWPQLGHCDPPVRARQLPHTRTLDGMAPAWAHWVERWHATSTLTPRVRTIGALHHGQGRAVAGRRAPRDHRTRPVDRVDLRGLGRRRRPDARRRLRPTPRRARSTAPATPIAPRTKAHHPHRQPDRSSATARNGTGSPAASTRPGRWPPRAASPR